MTQAVVDTTHAYALSPMGRMGESATGALDYAIVLVACVAVVLSVALMILWLIRPGEDSPNHIKRQILRE
jgi:hypothetical protein